MAAKYILIAAIVAIALQESLCNAPVAPGKAWEGRAQSGYVRKADRDRKAVEVGRVDAVGVEKTNYRQRHIHTNSPYYSGYGGGGYGGGGYGGGYYPSSYGYGGYGHGGYGHGGFGHFPYFGHGYGHGYPLGSYYGHGHGHGLGGIWKV